VLRRVFFTTVAACALALGQEQWLETSHSDFADGVELDPSMYVSRRANLDPDSGCIEFFARFDVNNDGAFDLGTSSTAEGPVRLFYGPIYTPTVCSSCASSSGNGNIDLADLNLDGYAELVHSGGQIFWGTPSGPTAANPTLLPYQNSEAVYVYDIDRNGYLDLAFASVSRYVRIFWGSAVGYSQDSSLRIDVGPQLAHNIDVADFDKDGWGDLAFSSNSSYPSNLILYWGPNRTYHSVYLPFLANESHGLSVADLDRNGWLDLGACRITLK